ncbi:hypothetical protein VDGD_02747 [Verticillium dahliae]|nr:hypothetical protein VDGD_02747 [Verticillium dahliae]
MWHNGTDARRRSSEQQQQSPPQQHQVSEAQGIPDDMQGDVMNFSDLDLAQLGLPSEMGMMGTTEELQGSLSAMHPFDVNPSHSYPGSYSGEPLTFDNLDLSFDALPPDGPMTSFHSQGATPEMPHAWLDNSSNDINNSSTPPEPRPRMPQGTRSNDSLRFNHPSSLGSPRPLMSSHRQPTLPRRRSRYLRNSGEPATSSSTPLTIPTTPAAMTDNALDPMQRWQESPPESEAASLMAIAGALRQQQRDAPGMAAAVNYNSSSRPRGSRPTSQSSFGSRTSHSSRSVTSARSSNLPSTLRRSSGSRGNRIGRPKRDRSPNLPGKAPKDRRPFQCTFCCDTFKSKYDWARHEKSLHLSLESWVCCPHGGVVVSPATGRSHCAYCNMLDPDPSHLAAHNHDSCAAHGAPHVFTRKDHLIQHLRLAHKLETTPLIDGWKVEAPAVAARCGFCDARMASWPERVEHLARHFKAGALMQDWVGEHGFDPEIAARVVNDLPPYLIGLESRAPVPFSSTDPGTKDHLSQVHEIIKNQNRMAGSESWAGEGAQTAERGGGAEDAYPTAAGMEQSSGEALPATFHDTLAVHLGRFARHQMRMGIIPTDEMFREESRRIVYGSADPFDWTIAESDHWLAGFRERHVKGSESPAAP